MNSGIRTIPTRPIPPSLRSVMIVLFCNALLFFPAIFAFPGFIGDDHVVMEYLKQHPGTIIADDADAPFFLYTRPVSFSFFRLLHLVAPDDALTMKMITVSMHLVFAGILTLIFYAVGRITARPVPEAVVVLLSLIVTLHPDALLWVDWISNANELLMALLYSGGLFCLARYVTSESSSPVLPFTAFVLFLLSALAKQQSIHFPLLILFFATVVLRDRLSEQQRRTLTIVAVTGMTAVVALISVNYFVNVESGGIFRWEDLPKKPFAVIGTMLYIGMPLVGLDVYHFFVAQKEAAVIVMLVGIAATIVFRQRISWRIVGSIAAVAMIVFFPRFFGPGGERINAVQLIWFGILLCVLYGYYSRPSVVIPVLIILLAGNVIATGVVLSRQISDERYSSRLVAELRTLQGGADRPIYVLFSTMYLTWPQQYQPSGIPDTSERSAIVLSGVIAKPMVRDFGHSVSALPVRTNDTIHIHVTDPGSTLDVMKSVHGAVMVSGERSPQRGWKRVSYLLPETLRTRPMMFVYPSDSGWVQLPWVNP